MKWIDLKNHSWLPRIFSGSASSSGSVPLDKTRANYTLTNDSRVEKVEKWYLRPLNGLNSPHDGFAILTLLFPLYERYLRWKGYIKEKEKFSEWHPVFKEIAKHLGTTMKEAYDFWNHYRNGLLHRAAPEVADGITFELVRDRNFCIRRDGNRVQINPFKIRDVVVELVEQSRDMWNDPTYPLPTEFYDGPT